MQKEIKSLQEVSEEINETLGAKKEFNKKNKYYFTNKRGEKDVKLIDTKLSAELSFIGRNQPVSYGHFKSEKGYNSKYKKNTKKYANHYGEYLAYIVLKQLGKKACKVDLGNLTISHPYSQKETIIEGCLSHFQLSREESFKPISIILENYKSSYPKQYRELTERGKTNSNKNYTNVELILQSLEEMYKTNGQTENIPEMRKSFFDMCIFDIKFANRDRHDDNFGVKVNQDTDQIVYYHLFDNEQFLGMQEDISSIRKYLTDEKQYQKFKEDELTSCIGIPGKTQKVKPMELLTYLLEKYPKETMNSLEDIGRYKISDLEKVMEICPDLSEEHKAFAKKIFLEKEKEIEDVINKFKAKKSKTTEEGPSL